MELMFLISTHKKRTMMNYKEVDYEALLDNVNSMISLLEYDAMRSPGKAKMNSQHLHSLYFLKEKYDEKMKVKSKPKSPKKEG